MVKRVEDGGMAFNQKRFTHGTHTNTVPFDPKQAASVNSAESADRHERAQPFRLSAPLEVFEADEKQMEARGLTKDQSSWPIAPH